MIKKYSKTKKIKNKILVLIFGTFFSYNTAQAFEPSKFELGIGGSYQPNFYNTLGVAFELMGRHNFLKYWSAGLIFDAGIYMELRSKNNTNLTLSYGSLFQFGLEPAYYLDLASFLSIKAGPRLMYRSHNLSLNFNYLGVNRTTESTVGLGVFSEFDFGFASFPISAALKLAFTNYFFTNNLYMLDLGINLRIKF